MGKRFKCARAPRAGDGSPETLVRTYFQLMGWPTMLASSDQESFVRRVHQAKQTALLKMLAEGRVPVRQGVSQARRRWGGRACMSHTRKREAGGARTQRGAAACSAAAGPTLRQKCSA